MWALDPGYVYTYMYCIHCTAGRFDQLQERLITENILAIYSLLQLVQFSVSCIIRDILFFIQRVLPSVYIGAAHIVLCHLLQAESAIFACSQSWSCNDRELNHL